MHWSKAGPSLPARPEHPLPEECWTQIIVVSAIPGSKLSPAYIDFGLSTLTSGGHVPDLRRLPGTESIPREQSRGEELRLDLMLKKSNFQPSCIDLSNSAEIKGRQPGGYLYFSKFWKPLLVSCFSKVGYREKRRGAARALAALARTGLWLGGFCVCTARLAPCRRVQQGLQRLFFAAHDNSFFFKAGLKKA